MHEKKIKRKELKDTLCHFILNVHATLNEFTLGESENMVMSMPILFGIRIWDFYTDEGQGTQLASFVYKRDGKPTKKICLHVTSIVVTKRGGWL